MHELTQNSAPPGVETTDETGAQSGASAPDCPQSPGPLTLGPAPEGAAGVKSPRAASADQLAKRYATKAELDEIRKVRPITADDLGPGPFAGGFTLEQELEYQNYVPDPIIISEERCRELADEAKKYAAEGFAVLGEPTPEEWRAAAQFWEAVVNRKMPENPLWLD